MATKKAAKKTAAKNAPVRRARPSAQTPPAQDGATALFEVLRPFKFAGVVVKPPSWVEMTDAEATQYQDAGVLGAEAALVPGVDDLDDEDDDPGSNSSGSSGQGAAGQGAQA